MTIIAVYKSQQVEILDIFTTGGQTWAVVKAITGRPFVGGDKWPVRTEFTTAPAAVLANVKTE